MEDNRDLPDTAYSVNGNGAVSKENLLAQLLAESSANAATPFLEPNPDLDLREDLTDVGNGRRFARMFGEDLRFAEDMGWYIWDGQRWKPSKLGEVKTMAKRCILTFYDDADRCLEEAKELTEKAKIADVADDKARALELAKLAGVRESQARAFRDWASKAQTKSRIDNMIDMAKSEQPIPAMASDFDSDPWLFNVANGTIDLRTGQLRPQRREDMITRIADIEYDKNATCARWLQFLSEIMNGKQSIVDFLRRAVGYSMTGDITEEILLFNYGVGKNGKTVFSETTGALMGDYWQKAPTEMLMRRGRENGIPNDIARLRGARFVMVAEVEEGSRLAEKTVKDLTGGDTLVARFLNKEFFEFTPTHTIWMYGNHRPLITGTDNGIWRRVCLIPFTVIIPPEKQDKDLKRKLRQELSGILNWAIQGCLEYRRIGGLEPPDEVAAATEQYRDESDTLGGFIADRTYVQSADGATIPEAKASDLRSAYENWCADYGENPIVGKRFFEQLAERGFSKTRKKTGVYYRGIGLLAA